MHYPPAVKKWPPVYSTLFSMYGCLHEGSNFVSFVGVARSRTMIKKLSGNQMHSHALHDCQKRFQLCMQRMFTLCQAPTTYE